MADICTDNRFELIDKYKKELIEATNIETSQDEMAVLDSLLFRFWQMKWLDRLEQPERKKGKWKEEIDTGERMLACSACGGRVFLETYETAVGEHGYRFCPYCGSRMER